MALYDNAHQMEPLLPGSTQAGSLNARAQAIAEQAAELRGHAHPVTRASIAELTRAMNSYYSNRIEGQSTEPHNIASALKADFSAEPDTAALQRLALAHISAEIELEAADNPAGTLLTGQLFLDAHRALYSRLDASERLSNNGEEVIPGALRTNNVKVGTHAAPAFGALPAFMRRFDQGYQTHHTSQHRLVVIACAHQRMAWIHPATDGNGRALRLQTHLAMMPFTGGLWSVNRGLARRRADYYKHLATADRDREGDLDGRGNLSERGLVAWVSFFLNICEDQVQFMQKTLAFDKVKQRIQALVNFEASMSNGIRLEATLPLYHVFAAGPLTRSEFTQMTGLGERTARKLLTALLNRGLLMSDSPRGPVRTGLPMDAVRFLLPDLFPNTDG